MSKRTKLTGLVLLGLIVLAAVFHGPLLTAPAARLVLPSEEHSADVALVGGGDRCYERIAERFREGGCDTVMIFRSRGSRLTELGILPTGDELAHRELAAHGVPEQALLMLDPVIHAEIDHLAVLERWLKSHPDRRIAVYCDRFSSRRLRWAYDRELEPDTAARVMFVPLPDRRYDETNWWQSKVGIKAFFKAWFLVGYDCLCGEQPPRKAPLSAEEYEGALFR
jgi:hypothetical protein